MPNNGIQNTGSGVIHVSGSAVGERATVHAAGTSRREEDATGNPADWRADVGVITVLSEETSALTAALSAAGSIRSRVHDDRSHCSEAHVGIAGRTFRVAATQTATPGQRSAVNAFQRLQRYHAPMVVALVGIAGGVHPAISLGDVVVVQEVIYYDLRKETPGGTLRRGQARPVPVGVGHAINHFFSANGEPYQAVFGDPDGVSRRCNVLRGPVASGEAVVADARSAIRRYVRGFNDKTLALEIEAGGVAEAFHEMAANSSTQGWLAVRGISDHADAAKDDSYHDIASWHAASTLLQLLPYLLPEPGLER